MSDVAVCRSVSGDGNTISPPRNACIRWCFTLNNYTFKEFNEIESKVRMFCRYAIIAKEVGESGTPHLQGYIEFKTRRRPIGVFGLKRIHWERAKGSKTDNYLYCSKDDPKPFKFPEEYSEKIEEFYWWQDDIKRLLNSKPDDRTIHWYWEPEGCKGKTTFCKWLCCNYDKVICLSGKASDMKYGIVKFMENLTVLPNVVIVDIPRSKSEFVSYSGIEEVKDMFFFCGKYESAMINGARPHVIVFANCEPMYEKLSTDRWRVVDISAEHGGP